MSKTQHNVASAAKDEVFEPRLDFFWQSIAVYACILIVYSLISSTVYEGKLMLVVWDPVVILLTLFILVSAFSLANNYLKKRTLIVGKDFIALKSRFGVRKFSTSDIKKISFVKVKMFKVKGAYKLVRIWLINRRRPLKIRTSSYWDETRLIESISKLKSQYAK